VVIKDQLATYVHMYYDSLTPVPHQMPTKSPYVDQQELESLNS